MHTNYSVGGLLTTPFFGYSNMRRNQEMRISTRQLAFAGLFTALAFVLRLLSFTTLDYRFTFDDIAIMASGIFFGPWIGMLVGFSADALYALYAGFPLGLFTVASMSWGLVSGLLLYKNDANVIRFSLAVIVTSIVAFGLSTLALFQLFNTGIIAGLLPRVLTLVFKWPLQVSILWILLDRTKNLVFTDD
jgi:ECF transporter S component (folate family)